MPLYLVRWPTFSASIVYARNELHLLEQLDEEADTEGCRWTVYKGPLWVSLDLPVRCDLKANVPVAVEDLVITGAESIGMDFVYDTSIGGSVTYEAIVEKVSEWAFPVLSKALHAARMLNEDPGEPAVLRALHGELASMFETNACELERPKPEQDLSHEMNRHFMREFGIAVTPAVVEQAMQRLSLSAPGDEPGAT